MHFFNHHFPSSPPSPCSLLSVASRAQTCFSLRVQCEIARPRWRTKGLRRAHSPRGGAGADSRLRHARARTATAAGGGQRADRRAAAALRSRGGTAAGSAERRKRRRWATSANGEWRLGLAFERCRDHIMEEKQMQGKASKVVQSSLDIAVQ
jgi:hypothetical protein